MDENMTDLERDLYTALRMFVYGSAPSDPDERLELAKAALERAEGKTEDRATQFLTDRPGWSIEACQREKRYYVTIHTADLKWVCTTVGQSLTEALAGALDEVEGRV